MPEEYREGFYRKILDEVGDGVYFVDSDRRITYWNRGAERITGFTAEEVLGKRCSENVLMHVDETGRPLCEGACPALDSMDSGKPRGVEVYVHHRDGHRVPVATRVSPHFEDGRVIGAVEVFAENWQMVAARRKIDELERLALLDQLTGLGNRRHAEIHLGASLDQLARYGWPFALLFYDIDNFKLVNDTYGHETGDEVLKMVARTTQGALRSFDIVSRWGGEEFTAIVVNAEKRYLEDIGDKVRSLVEQSSFVRNGELVRVTVSVGVTPASEDDTIATLVDRADRLMYSSKEAGRNRVTLG
jgi:diguanylate cyclase (GGDEF)-like protein/PAS domain S-box-containing protein